MQMEVSLSANQTAAAQNTWTHSKLLPTSFFSLVSVRSILMWHRLLTVSLHTGTCFVSVYLFFKRHGNWVMLIWVQGYINLITLS